MLQPLVENALEHGFKADGTGLTVDLTARLTPSGAIELSVRDDGKGVGLAKRNALERGEGMGIGLASVRERIVARTPAGTLEVNAPGHPPGRRPVVAGAGPGSC